MVIKRNTANGMKIKITNNASYRIIDNTIYVFLDDISDFMTICKKIKLVMEDNKLSYINMSMANLENKKKFFLDLGFTLSYFDVKKINTLYHGYKDKSLYRCYAFITKKDFDEMLLNVKQEEVKKRTIISDDGYVLNLSLLFGGIILLCYFCVYGAISLVR